MMIVLAALCIQGCSKDVVGEAQAHFGGPTSATLIVLGSSSSSSTKATVDETNLVHSIRIYAFKHSPNNTTENNEMVGYYYNDNLSGSGPYYCTMALSASGYIDFYVLCNDEYANITSINDDETAVTLSESSTRTEIESVRFDGMTGYTADGTTNTIAVPMSNIEDTTVEDISLTEGSTDDLGNNFTFYVPETSQSTSTKIINIEVTRAMARLSLYFAKTTDLETTTVLVNSVTLNGMESTVLLCPPGTSQVFDTESTAYTDAFFTSTSGVEITKVDDELLSTDVSHYDPLTYDGSMTGTTSGAAVTTYMLPNPYGSSSTGAFVYAPNSINDGTGAAHCYRLAINYKIGTNDAEDVTLYLPVVSTNSHVRVMITFEEAGVSATMNVTVVSWTTYTMDTIYFD